MPGISVITLTVRPEAVALVIKALKRQTFKDFEWIIASAFPVISSDLKYTWLVDLPIKEVD